MINHISFYLQMTGVPGKMVFSSLRFAGLFGLVLMMNMTAVAQERSVVVPMGNSSRHLDHAEFLYHSLHTNTTAIRFEDKSLGVEVFPAPGASQIITSNYVFGTDRIDAIVGDQAEDHLYGMDGEDTIYGYGGDDFIEGGKGRDSMYGGSGWDTFYVQGEDADYDIFNGGANTDRISGSSGNDCIRVHIFSGEDTVERIEGGGGDDSIAGTDGSDLIDLSATTLIGITEVRGGGGADIIIGGKGNYDDHLYGGEKGDTLRGMGGNDHLYGTRGDLSDDNARDILEGGAGKDTYYVGHRDIIDDADQTGSIVWRNQKLSSQVLKKIARNSTTYRSDDHGYTAILDENSNTLIVSISEGGEVKSFSIRNFTLPEALEISLVEYEYPQSDFVFDLNSTDSTR